MSSRSHQLSAFGQSVWIDYLSRDLIESGALPRAVAEDAVVGATSARNLFDQLAAVGIDYDGVTATLEREGIEKFVGAFDELLQRVSDKRRHVTAAA
jgi:transaldolase